MASINDNGCVITDKNLIALLFSEYFQTVFMRDVGSLSAFHSSGSIPPIANIEVNQQGLLYLQLKIYMKNLPDPMGY